MVKLVDRVCLLEKFPGKGGWTFTRVPEIVPDKKAPFGWVRVSGSIDGFQLEKYHLMPMGNGHLFLPVRAEIRKKIKKAAGQEVHVILFADNSTVSIPADFEACLQDEPKAYKQFMQLPDNRQQAIVQYIYAAKRPETQAERIAETIDTLLRQ